MKPTDTKQGKSKENLNFQVTPEPWYVRYYYVKVRKSSFLHYADRSMTLLSHFFQTISEGLPNLALFCVCCAIAGHIMMTTSLW